MTKIRNARTKGTCLTLFLLLMTLGCAFYASAAQDPVFPEGYPEELRSKKLRDSEFREIAPGVNYYHYHFDDIEGQPLSLYYVVIDWDKANVKLNLAQCGKKLKTVMEMVKDKKPLAAVNGAYFRYKGPVTYYPLKIEGKVFLPNDKYDTASALVFNDGDFPQIVPQKEYDAYENAIMGYHIWKNGKYALGGEQQSSALAGDTPLTGIGLNPEKRLLVFMVCDGRFKDESPGLNFYGEGYFLIAAGCTDVISIDGGGSCTMLIKDKKKGLELKNRPSDNRKFDHKGARKVHNCIYLTGK